MSAYSEPAQKPPDRVLYVKCFENGWSLVLSWWPIWHHNFKEGWWCWSPRQMLIDAEGREHSRKISGAWCYEPSEVVDSYIRDGVADAVWLMEKMGT